MHVIMQARKTLDYVFSSRKWLRAKWEHRAGQLENNRLVEIAKRNDIDFFWKYHLKPILIERIPGTKNHELVRNHIIARMKGLSAGWHIELDEFVDKPPEPYPEVRVKHFHFLTVSDLTLIFAC